MLRTGLITIAMIAALQGICFGQGFLDSILGPGGLGLWGSGDAPSQQYNNPKMGRGAQGPTQQLYQQPAASGQQQTTYPPAGAQAYPRSYPEKGYGYPQQGYSYQQQGVHGDPQQYSATQVSSAPQQHQAPQQSRAPQQYTAPLAQATPGRPAQAAPRQPSLRPGQHAPGHAPVTADDLPPGAVRMTTTTPEGAWVQYYPPTDEPGAPQGTIQRPARQLKPKPAAAKAQSVKRAQPHAQTTNGTESPDSSAIEMPKIPQSLDPRNGWDTAVNRGPVAPAAR
jgi:hypothetical protein